MTANYSGGKKSIEPAQKLGSLFGLTLPNDQYPPSEYSQLSLRAVVSPSILRKFTSPEGTIRLRLVCVAASGVLMPKAAMYEYDFLKTGEH
jgi:hypothetical protein